MESAGATILVVDDDPDIREVLKDRLESFGYRVLVASSGKECLEVLDKQSPELVLLDIGMPGMNGIEVVRRLKQDEKYKGIPVILLTAKGSQEDKVEGLDAGADDYVVKPFDSFELLARVRSMMRIKQMHDALEEWNRTLEEKVRQQVEEIERVSRCKRYLSPQIAETILKSEDETLFRSHRREITVAFLDLRGFTAFSDSAEPEEVMELLRSYHAEMGSLIFKFEGTIEHFSGDGIMVFFNDPIPCEDHTEKAVRMALEIRARVKELRAGWLKKGYDLDLGVGLASGYATLGNIGFEGRMDYGAVGNVTNLSARLCEKAGGGQILTDRKTFSKIEDLVEAEPLEELHPKGLARPIAAFNIVGLKQF